MFDYVKDYGLVPTSPYKKRKQTQRILLHMTGGGSAESVLGIHAYHLSKGHKGIDYNICVQKDGTVVWGRGLEMCGGSVNNSNAKTRGMNDTSVAIVALGDFEHEQMGDAQKNALKRITRDVAQYYGITEIKGHNEVAGRDYTDCPGQYYPLDEVRNYALGNVADAPAKPAQDANQALIKQRIKDLQGALNTDYNAGLAVDGICGQRTDAAVRAHMVRYKLIKMRGATVAWIQCRLGERGYPCGASGVDGVWGRASDTALRQYQRAHGLTADGIAGVQTIQSLYQ